MGERGLVGRRLVGQRVGRVEWLISGITYLAILWLQGTIYNALGFFDQSSDVSMLGMQISSNREVITLDPQYVIFQITLSALLLLISGWMFDQQDL